MSTDRKIRIIIADDQALVRGGFRVLVDSAADLEVVGEASDGAEAVRMARELTPDVVLMDIRMPGMDGLEATRLILAETAPESEAEASETVAEDDVAEAQRTRVLVLTTFDIDEYVYAALRAGASGFVLKDIEPDDLLNAIRVVASGEALLAPSVTRRLISEFASRPDPQRTSPAALAVLTEREREVLALVARGLTNHEIADSLVISPATAKTHVSRVMIKLGARDRAQLVVIAYETGLVQAHPQS